MWGYHTEKIIEQLKTCKAQRFISTRRDKQYVKASDGRYLAANQQGENNLDQLMSNITVCHVVVLMAQVKQ